jgi:uncharacterized membrane protein YtjA (UPF0391 family)
MLPFFIIAPVLDQLHFAGMDGAAKLAAMIQ